MAGATEALTREELMRDVRARHPGLIEALIADARVTALYRGERHEFRSRGDALAQALRLAWQSDAFMGQALYRLKARLQRAGIPVLPRLAHRLAIAIAQVQIGDPVTIQPGLYLMHGQVVIDGIVEIGRNAVIGPFVTIGLRGDFSGPVLGADVHLGTGAKVLGAVRVNDGARIGANAVVLEDVPAGATAVGIPARVGRPGSGND